jgi:hypothetical protein
VKTPKTRFLLVAAALFLGAAAADAGDPALRGGFARPPGYARPWVYWFWINGNISTGAITADLEAMQRVGIGGVLIMEVDPGLPAGPVAFGSAQWRELFRFACGEAKRLGLEVNLSNDAGWTGSAGPWITPELSMQKVVWTETKVRGPRHFEEALAEPARVAGYYRDIVLLGFPTPPDDSYRIADIDLKATFISKTSPYGTDLGIPRLPITFPELPKDREVDRSRILNLTARMKDGRLSWDVPDGNWTILRFGHTSTGVDNHPAPEGGRGLECDKLSRAAADVHFAGFLGKIIADAGPLAGDALVSAHIDSWEVGAQNWTPLFGEEFQKRNGYDLVPFMPTLTGRVVGDLETSERFLWDFRRTISDLLNENYAGRLRELANRHGLRLSIEAYDATPVDDMSLCRPGGRTPGRILAWARLLPRGLSLLGMVRGHGLGGPRLRQTGRGRRGLHIRWGGGLARAPCVDEVARRLGVLRGDQPPHLPPLRDAALEGPQAGHDDGAMGRAL